MQFNRLPRAATLLLSALLATAVARPLSAQRQLIVLDLAAPIDSVRVGSGSYAIRLEHALPASDYTVSWGITKRGSPPAIENPFTLKGFLPAGGVAAMPPATKCAIRQVLAKNFPVRAEDAIETALETLREARSADAAENADCVAADTTKAETELQTDRYRRTDTTTIKVGDGEVAVITIIRGANPVASVVLLSTTERQGATITYGVGFPFGNGMSRFSVGAPQDTAGNRPIRRLDARDAVNPNFTLAVNVPLGKSWYVTGFLPTTIVDGVVTGWGAGVSYALGDLFWVHAGTAFGPQRRLLSQYRSGETIKEALTEDQITETYVVPRMVLGFSLRLSANPFAKAKPEPANPE